MELSGKDGQAFRMRIAGYQFPDMQTGEYDSNWLRIEGTVRHARGSWRFSDPCLLTYEASRVASWIESIAEGADLPSCCGFIEPNLEFSALVEERPILRVYFELEARPAWATSTVAGAHDLWVEFLLVELDLRSAAQQWRQQVAAWPQRAAR